jgi:DNA-directed RNA polymerase specialized sigma24 family protein
MISFAHLSPQAYQNLREELLRHIHRLISMRAYSIGSEEEALIVDEAITALLEKSQAGVLRESDARAYANAIIYNKLMGRLRSRYRQSKIQNEIALRVANEVSDPESRTLDHLEIASVARVLSPLESQILSLVLSGRTQLEIASKLGITRHKVRATLVRVSALCEVSRKT